MCGRGRGCRRRCIVVLKEGQQHDHQDDVQKVHINGNIDERVLAEVE